MKRLHEGVRIDKGYVQVRIMHKGRFYCKNFQADNDFNRERANAHAAEVKLKMKMGIFQWTEREEARKFKEVAPLFFNIWKKETDGQGKIVHNENSQYKCNWTIERVLIPAFGDFNFHEIPSVEIEKWRNRLIGKGISPTTLNRYQAILSSIFSHTTKWVKVEKIKPAFKLPEENPCENVEMAKANKRTRILTKYEAQKLKWALEELQDPDGWEICKLALKSVLSLKDLKGLEVGQEIDLERSKTGVPVNIPITILTKLDFTNWRKRWESAREKAGLADVQFRDLRKTGINWLKGRHDLKLVSEYAGHANVKTTEKSYTIKQAEYLQPLTEDLSKQVEEL